MKKYAVIIIAMVLAAGTAEAVTWSGGNTNWTEPDSDSFDSEYTVGLSVDFTTNGAGGVVVTNAGVSPGAINVTSGSYTFSGGSIGGIGMLTKAGSGTLTISSAITGSRGIGWGAGGAVTLSSTSNTFTGPINGSGATGNDYLYFTSIGDAPGAGAITLNKNSWEGHLIYNGSSNLILNYRKIGIGGNNVSGMGYPCNCFEISGSGTVTINTDLIVSGAGAKLLGLGGSNTGTNSINGRVPDGAGALTIHIVGANWYFSGTNTYSGGTSARGGKLTFQGIQALPSSGTVNFSGGLISILDDGWGVIDRSGANLQENNNAITLFVGNNNTANGGRSSGTTAGSVISLGVLNMATSSGWWSRQMNITGANGYSVRLAGANLSWWGSPYAEKFNPTTASIQITGTVQQVNGKTLASLSGGSDAQPSPYLSLDGTATGNIISGIIKDALDYTDLSNPNARALGVTKANTSEWTLAGTNTYTGTNTLTQGTLSISEDANLGKTNALVFNGGTLRITGTTLNSYVLGQIGTHPVTLMATTVGLDIADPANTFTVSTVLNHGSGGLAKAGVGTLVLTATNTYTGTTTISRGTLTLRDAGAGLAQTLGALTLAGPDVTLQSDRVVGPLSTSFGTLTARVAGNTANIVYTGGTIGSDNRINITNSVGFINKGIFLNGADYAAMNAANTYVRALIYGSDGNTLPADTIGTGNHVKLTATPVIQNSIALLSLNLAGSGINYTNNAGQVLTVPGIIKAGGGTNTISGGTVTGGAGIELVIRTDTAPDSLAVDTPVTGTGALTKSGAGTLVLSGTNTYSGASYINGGTFLIGGSGQLGSGTYATNIINNGVFVYGSSATQSISGVISGGGSLTMSGSGKLTLSGTNTYTGSTMIGPGTLEIGGTGLLGSGIYGASITNNGTFLYNSSATQVVTCAISGMGTTTINAGTFCLQGSFSNVARVRVVTGGKLVLNYAGTNNIFQLYLDGVPVYGIWGAVGSGAINQSTLLAGTGIIQIPPVAGTVVTLR